MNNKFDKRLATIPSEIITKIARIDELKGRWIGGLQLNPQALGRLKRSVLVTSTGSSTRIEGAKLSDEEVEKLMMGVKTKRFADRDAQEVQGYFDLLQNLFDSWKTIKFSENTIKHFHNELVKHVDKDQRHRGDYKKVENTVEMFDRSGKSLGIVFQPTKAYLTPKEMQELMEWTEAAFVQKKYHPLLIIGNFLVEFLKVHPFQDGNGRLSRILTNLLLLKEGYLFVPYVSHEKLIEDNKNDYYLALRRRQTTFGKKKEDIVPWLDYFLDIVLRQSEMAIGLLETEDVEKLLSPKQLVIWKYIQDKGEAAPLEISRETKIAKPTVIQALNRLMKLGKIERIGMGRGTRYRKR
ncbi:MAG: Adenosine monophosphate-protein transferase SoFic [Syntrophorhabdaceae bacterium PtaU1.Bin034]|nr:MAG: Adenosine monophosphate-protein transferase SoFic [Syntrophorhabdaceae bacterium PtaU1.Bin034]